MRFVYLLAGIAVGTAAAKAARTIREDMDAFSQRRAREYVVTHMPEIRAAEGLDCAAQAEQTYHGSNGRERRPN